MKHNYLHKSLWRDLAFGILQCDKSYMMWLINGYPGIRVERKMKCEDKVEDSAVNATDKLHLLINLYFYLMVIKS